MNDQNDQQDEAVKADVEENNKSESPADETNLPEAETVNEEVATESTTEPEAESKKSAGYRVKEALKERDEALGEVKSLKDRIAELTGQVGSMNINPQVPEKTEPVESNFDPDTEKILRQREQENFQKTQSQVELMLARERNLNRIEKESTEALKKYPELDPDSDVFDRDISDSVSEAALAFAVSNPTKSVKEFVDKLMKPYKRSIEKAVGEQKETITKQASQGALRPTQVPKGEKPFSELSLKEMEERLGGVRH